MVGSRLPSLPLVPLPQDTALRILLILKCSALPPLHRPAGAICSQWPPPPPQTGLPASAPAPRVWPPQQTQRSYQEQVPLRPSSVTHSPWARRIHSAAPHFHFLPPFPSLRSSHTGPWLILHYSGQVPDLGPSLALLSTRDSPGTGCGASGLCFLSDTSLCSHAALPQTAAWAGPDVL